MKPLPVILVAFAAAALSIVAIRANRQRHTSQLSYQQANSTSGAVARIQQPRVPSVTPQLASASAFNSIASTGGNATVEKAATNSAAGNPADEPLADPFARIALTFVGADPDAEAYWFAAINDLSLPPNERQDLIEDLNEVGLPDPEHPTVDDLPLIFNRLALIETIGPDAADEVNADAFLEAYKDLLNLAELAMGGGEPVK
jgi:hypothetical protein